MAYGKEKDDNENKGRKGKGPKKMKVKKESARKERKNLLKYNPVVDKSDDNENIGRQCLELEELKLHLCSLKMV